MEKISSIESWHIRPKQWLSAAITHFMESHKLDNRTEALHDYIVSVQNELVDLKDEIEKLKAENTEKDKVIDYWKFKHGSEKPVEGAPSETEKHSSPPLSEGEKSPQAVFSLSPQQAQNNSEKSAEESPETEGEGQDPAVSAQLPQPTQKQLEQATLETDKDFREAERFRVRMQRERQLTEEYNRRKKRRLTDEEWRHMFNKPLPPIPDGVKPRIHN